MFRRQVKGLSDVLNSFMRQNGLETPLLQKRTIDAWDTVVGQGVVRYTTEKYIRNQTLFIRITNPALRQDLSMMRSRLLQRIREAVGSEVVTDIRFF